MLVWLTVDEHHALKKLLAVQEETLGERLRLGQTVATLKTQIADLEIEKGKKQEGFDRRERELTHMVGLEHKRQEIEIAQAKKEAVLVVREENLVADRKRLQDEMAFQRDMLAKHAAEMRSLLTDVLARLPNVNVEWKKK